MKPKFTVEQEQAIHAKGSNVLVSAGAGSGKTAILTERVIVKLIDGTPITELVIITFTKAAAIEVVERIRSKISDNIKEYPHLSEQLNLIDSAYITTFDAYCMSLLKKYHYVLNLDPNLKIGDTIIFQENLKRIMDEIFEEKILDQESDFYQLIMNYSISDANLLKDNLIKVYYKYQTDINPPSSVDEQYSNQQVELYLTEYLAYIDDQKNELKVINQKLATYCDDKSEEYINRLIEFTTDIINTKSYDDLKFQLEEKLLAKSRAKFDHKVEINALHDQTKLIYLNLIKLTEAESFELLTSDYTETKIYAGAVIDFICELQKRYMMFKYQNNSFEFSDIIKMCIKVFEENEDIRLDVQASISEIMIDEYQDTDDFQNRLVDLIANDNIYMVGDIKQSIYGFRNANPDNFAAKYDKYLVNDGGQAIELTKNFRSNEGVLESINDTFSKVMSKEIGGVDYTGAQVLGFGNKRYETSDNVNQYRIMSYDKELVKEFPMIDKDEYEALLMAKDIIDKINNKYQVLDMTNNVMRSCNLGDFAILSRNKKRIAIYNKVLRSVKLVVDAQTDASFKRELEIILIKNILIAINANPYHDKHDYKNALIAILRSYIYQVDDAIIDQYFRNYDVATLKDTPFKEVIDLIDELKKDAHQLNNQDLVLKIINDFKLFEKIGQLNDPQESKYRIFYIIEVARSIDDLFYDLNDFIKYFDALETLDQDIVIKFTKENNNAIKIMTYHASKGLEFPVVYLPNLGSRFNKSDLNERILYDSKYGLVISNSYRRQEQYGRFMKDTFLKELLRNKINNSIVSEEIRMLYVAMTRAKEELVLIKAHKDSDYDLGLKTDNNFNSYLDMISCSVNFEHKDLVEVTLCEELLATYKAKTIDAENKLDDTNVKIDFKTIETNPKTIIKSRASMHNVELIPTAIATNIDRGNQLHLALEFIDFTNIEKELGKYGNDVDNIILNMLELDIFKNNINYFKEYEYTFQKDHQVVHGIIDLLIEKEDCFIIVDYKLSNIDNDKYLDQINTYKEFIMTKTQKPVYGYLYSLTKNTLKEVK